MIDGAKALRAAIGKVFGSQHPVQRCRNHKIRNVVERLPEEQKDQVKATMRASYKLEAKQGMARLESWPTAGAGTARRREQFAGRAGGMFHHQPPGNSAVVASLLGHELIESPQSGVRLRTRRCRWRDTAMVARWAAASFLARRRTSAASWAGRTLATGSDLRKKNDGNCCSPPGGRVT